MNKDFNTICEKYNILDVCDVVPFGKGNINNTFKVSTQNGNEYLLQKLNANALPNIMACLSNIEVIGNHLKSLNQTRLHLILTKDGKNHIVDENGNIWRMYPFFKDSKSFDFTTDEKIISEIAYGFGLFDKCLKSLSTKKVKVSDKYFHNTLQKYKLLKSAIKQDVANRVQSARKEIEWAEELKTNAQKLGIDLFSVCNAVKRGELCVQVVHNDTKINNCLLNKNNKFLCVVDLDTAMPGSILNDFGDGIRYIANSATEETENLNEVKVNLKSFKAFANGFFKGFGNELTAKEKELLPVAPIAIAFELGCRFLADYLNGDVFFKIVSNKPDFNLIRARVQFKLCQEFIDNFKEMKKIMNDILKQ